MVVVFLQVIPQVKRRGYRQLLEAYEASLREDAHAGDPSQRNDAT